jgi:hypothetical protein
MEQPLLIQGMHGLGDSIYQRPFVGAAASRFDVYLETSWPQLYADMPVRPVERPVKLRTQTKNAKRQAAAIWSQRPAGARAMQLSYGPTIRTTSIVHALERQLPLNGAPLTLDLPPLPASQFAGDKPIAFFRPAAVRKEWRSEARNPRPEYLIELAEFLRHTHRIGCVADLEDGEEWLAGPAPRGDLEFLRGELDLIAMLALFNAADLAIGGVGWIVPAALALKKRAFVVLGGNGAYNAPAKITDPRLDCSNLGFATPRNYCQCTDMLHRCDKSIPDLMMQFQAFLARTGCARSAPVAA